MPVDLEDLAMENGREVIIIVDDDATNLTVGKSTLSEKYDVYTTSSGEKLFSLLEKLSPDLLPHAPTTPNLRYNT